MRGIEADAAVDSRSVVGTDCRGSLATRVLGDCDDAARDCFG